MNISPDICGWSSSYHHRVEKSVGQIKYVEAIYGHARSIEEHHLLWIGKRVVQGGVLEFSRLCNDCQTCPTIIKQPNLPVRAYTAVSICSSLKMLHSFWAAEHKSPRKKNLSTSKVFTFHDINGQILELPNQTTVTQTCMISCIYFHLKNTKKHLEIVSGFEKKGKNFQKKLAVKSAYFSTLSCRIFVKQNVFWKNKNLKKMF